jgi:hypothetical protein
MLTPRDPSGRGRAHVTAPLPPTTQVGGREWRGGNDRWEKASEACSNARVVAMEPRVSAPATGRAERRRRGAQEPSDAQDTDAATRRPAAQRRWRG